jgi:hypothetical protein
MMAAASVAISSSLLVGGLAGSADASRQTQGDGLVNVQVGDITVKDINVGVAAEIIVQACDLVDANAALLLVENVDQTNTNARVCRTESGPVKVKQN